MLVAYLRGLLKPDYPNGVNSLIREELILQEISKEQSAESLKFQALVSSAQSGCYDMSQAKKVIDYHREFIVQYNNLIFGTKDSVIHQKSVDATVKVYHALEKAGLL